MISLLILGQVVTLSTRDVPPPAICEPTVTNEDVLECLRQDQEAVDATRRRYTAAVLEQIKARGEEDGDPEWKEDRDQFLIADKLWDQTATAHCDAVYRWWRRGTIRFAFSAACHIHMTQLRTHTIWREWLTYPDSTPPVLPEPPVPTH